MKKMFKLFMCAAVVAAGFTACSEEVNPINPEPDETETAILTVNFKNPTTYAADNNATDAECKVNNVTIFLFNAAGVCKVNTTLDMTQVGNGTNPNEYTARIEVPLGRHSVFAGVNLTKGSAEKMVETLIKSYGFDLPVDLGPKDAPTIAGIQELYTADNFPMFSDNVQGINIVPTPATGQNPNTVDISLNRMVAKITVRKSSTFDTDQANLQADGATFKAADVTWAMGNLNGKIFPYAKANENNGQDPNYDFAGELKSPADYIAKNFKNDFATTDAKYSDWDVTAFVAIDDNGTTVKSLKSKYAPENNSKQKRDGETTFAAVKARFAPDKIYTFDVSVNTTPQEVATTGYTPSLNEDKTYHVVRSTKTYYFADEDQAKAYKTFLESPEGGNQKGIRVETFYGQYCFYHIFMGSRTTNRNNYYDITLNKFNGLGTPTGEVDDEDVDNTGDNKAQLDVNIVINPWNPVSEPTDLEK
jgi:hypothetical protein